MKHVSVVVIGGGITGAGIIRDLALRGIDALLVEMNDLGTGTSGRFHGLLHSGGRYAVKDPVAAKECIEENRIFRQTMPFALDAEDGLFVSGPDDDPAWADQWAEACAKVGISVEEISTERARELEPALAKDIQRAFLVPDGSVDAWQPVAALTKDAKNRGAQIRTYTRVTALHQSNQQITGVTLTNLKTGEQEKISCDLVINATGAWASKVTELVGIKLPMALDKGAMLVYGHRLVNRVVNRLRPATDGDILVPVGTVSIWGTTAVPIDDPEDRSTTEAHIRELAELGRPILPGLPEARLLRVFVGVRPLYKEQQTNGNTRNVTRGIILLDHEQRDGLKGLITITGGKWTTYRLMAEKTVDLACEKLNLDRPCTTHVTPVAPDPACRVPAMRRDLAPSPSQDVVCDCEGTPWSLVEQIMREYPGASLSDLRRRARIGLGPCQGTFCTYRVAARLVEAGYWQPAEANRYLAQFLADRWRGQWPVVAGQQAREIALTRQLYGDLLGVLTDA